MYTWHHARASLLYFAFQTNGFVWARFFVHNFFPYNSMEFLSRLKIFAVDEYPGCIFSATLRPKKYATLDFYFFKCYLLRTHTQFYQLFMKHVWTFCSINTKLNWKKRLRDLEWRSIFALYSSHINSCTHFWSFGSAKQFLKKIEQVVSYLNFHVINYINKKVSIKHIKQSFID